MAVLTITAMYFLVLGIFSLGFPSQLIFWGFILSMASTTYWIHRLGHGKQFALWTEAHRGHHDLFPARNFRSYNEYRLNTADRYSLNSVLYVLGAGSVLAAFHLIFDLSIYQTAYLSGITTLLLLVENIVHEWIHTKPPEFVAKHVKGYWHYLVRIHYLHHDANDYAVDENRNFAVVALWLDVLFGSYRSC